MKRAQWAVVLSVGIVAAVILGSAALNKPLVDDTPFALSALVILGAVFLAYVSLRIGDD